MLKVLIGFLEIDKKQTRLGYNSVHQLYITCNVIFKMKVTLCWLWNSNRRDDPGTGSYI